MRVIGRQILVDFLLAKRQAAGTLSPQNYVVKTLVTLWVAEARGDERILVLVPTNSDESS